MLKAIETKDIAIQSEPPSKMNSGTWTQEMDTFEAFFRGKTAEELRTLPSSKRFVNLTVLSGAASEAQLRQPFFVRKGNRMCRENPGRRFGAFPESDGRPQRINMEEGNGNFRLRVWQF